MSNRYKAQVVSIFPIEDEVWVDGNAVVLDTPAKSGDVKVHGTVTVSDLPGIPSPRSAGSWSAATPSLDRIPTVDRILNTIELYEQWEKEQGFWHRLFHGRHHP